MDAIVDLIKFTLPAAAVLYAMYLVVRTFVVRELESKKTEIRSRSIETILPSRLQAYERICLLLERLTPQNLMLRVLPAGMSVKEYQRVLLEEIRNEYNHNVSQQIYMSEQVWGLVRNSREYLIVLINESAAELSAESTGLDLAKRVMERSTTHQVDPFGHALSELKKEIQQIF